LAHTLRLTSGIEKTCQYFANVMRMVKPICADQSIKHTFVNLQGFCSWHLLNALDILYRVTHERFNLPYT